MTLDDLATVWHTGMEQSAYEYAHKHPELYRRMLIGATAHYRGEVGGALKAHRVVEHAAAMSNGYPSWDAFLSSSRPATTEAA
jgi:hypothetical protein